MDIHMQMHFDAVRMHNDHVQAAVNQHQEFVDESFRQQSFRHFQNQTNKVSNNETDNTEFWKKYHETEAEIERVRKEVDDDIAEFNKKYAEAEAKIEKNRQEVEAAIAAFYKR